MKKNILVILLVITGISVFLIFSSNKRDAFCKEFIHNVNNPEFKNGERCYVGKISIGENVSPEVVYFTSAISCGKYSCGFDFCLLRFPDNSIYYEDTYHYCGKEGASSILNSFDKSSIVNFLVDAKKHGFKNIKEKKWQK